MARLDSTVLAIMEAIGVFGSDLQDLLMLFSRDGPFALLAFKIAGVNTLDSIRMLRYDPDVIFYHIFGKLFAID